MLKGVTSRLWRHRVTWRHRGGHHWRFASPWPLSYRLPIVTYPLAPFVSEIFDLKVADAQTYKQTSTPSDNKGRLKLSAREPTDAWITVDNTESIICVRSVVTLLIDVLCIRLDVIYIRLVQSLRWQPVTVESHVADCSITTSWRRSRTELLTVSPTCAICE